MIPTRTYLTILVIVSFAFLQCENATQSEYSKTQADKEYPNDLFSFQRSYPYKKFDVKAFERGLEEARVKAAQRTSGNGFDEPWVNQGPGNAGARVNSIEVHPSNEDIIYLGFSSGGVFKTDDGGTSWNPIFDEQPFLAIGDIALDPNNSQTVYVGTGDPNITGYPAIGNGVYKSIDGGISWTHLGLSDQRIVSKIIVDPTDSNTIYVSCMGLPFERNNDRGLYKTIDGGANWTQILFVADQAGVIDMVMSPDDSQTLYVSSWDRIRNNEESIVYGPNAKIHKSTDGGSNWTVLTNGLPAGDQGRIGLAISESDPDVLVAVVVSTTSQNLEGIYRTEDAGLSWAAIPTGSQNGLGSSVLGGFGWYFGQIRIHPVNNDWIYLLGVSMWFTSNNGQIWTNGASGSSTIPHVDHHDLVFNFENDILLGNDGGAYKKENNSSNYLDIEDIPATQVYRVAYDSHHPNDYYGGTQDNGTQTGNNAGMADWDKVLGGDGFQMQFHPVDSNIVFAETQNGNIFRSSTGLSGFTSNTNGINPNDRKHWDMQYIISPHNPNRMYTGTYRVYKSETAGTLSWNSISDDLTDGIIYGSGFHTISTITESPVTEDLLYVGTTDANVWRTEDGGNNWDSLHMNLPERYITSVKASPDFSDNVYVCVSGYRYNEFTPRVYMSTDRGDNWTNIAGDLPDLAVNDIIIVPGQEDQVLFVATDGGVYGTTNGGVNWHRVGGTDFPMITTYDMEWNAANNELVAGTFGRSIYSYPVDSILNNIDNSINVIGQINTELASGVDSVLVSVTGGNNNTVQTDEFGDYSLSNISLSPDCEIIPAKDINIRNGVSTFDIVNMQSHILFNDTLDSPYKIIAGDVNNTGSVSVTDIIIIRKVILFDQDTFSNTPSWRFIPEDYVFSNPIKPFDDDFPELVSCEDVVNNGASSNFIALKVGDVTASADPGMFTEEGENRSDQQMNWIMPDVKLLKGQTYSIPVKINSFKDLTGFQFGLSLDQTSIEFINLGATESIDFNSDNYHFKSKTGALRLSWSDPNAVSFDENDKIIYLNIKSLKNIRLSEALSLNPDLLRPEAYDKNATIYEPVLSFQSEVSKSKLALTPEVFPNPFSENVGFHFELERPSEVSLEVFDLQGRRLYYSTKELDSGTQALNINANQFKAKGMYFYQLKTSEKTYSGKLILE